MPGDSAPAWLGSQPCLVDDQTSLFYVSNVASLTREERKCSEYACSVSESSRKWCKAVALSEENRNEEVEDRECLVSL